MNTIKIRQALASDAEGFLSLWDALDYETQFMLFEPNERKAKLSAQRSSLANAEISDDVQIFVLEDTQSNFLVDFVQVEEVVKINAVGLDHGFVDEHIMAKLI